MHATCVQYGIWNKPVAVNDVECCFVFPQKYCTFFLLLPSSMTLHYFGRFGQFQQKITSLIHFQLFSVKICSARERGLNAVIYFATAVASVFVMHSQDGKRDCSKYGAKLVNPFHAKFVLRSQKLKFTHYGIPSSKRRVADGS